MCPNKQQRENKRNMKRQMSLSYLRTEKQLSNIIEIVVPTIISIGETVSNVN